MDTADIDKLRPGSSAMPNSPAARAPAGSSSTGRQMLPKFVKVFPHEYKRVLGVPRFGRRE
jgi:hypothetical protein